MAVLTGIAVATLRFDRSEQQIDDNLHSLTQFYRGARDQALLTGTAMRLTVNKNTLQLQQQQRGQWHNTDEHLTLSEPLKWAFTPAPPIYLYPSGQSTPFRVQLFLANTTTPARQLSGDAMGRITVGAP